MGTTYPTFSSTQADEDSRFKNGGFLIPVLFIGIFCLIFIGIIIAMLAATKMDAATINQQKFNPAEGTYQAGKVSLQYKTIDGGCRVNLQFPGDNIQTHYVESCSPKKLSNLLKSALDTERVPSVRKALFNILEQLSLFLSRGG